VKDYKLKPEKKSRNIAEGGNKMNDYPYNRIPNIGFLPDAYFERNEAIIKEIDARLKNLDVRIRELKALANKKHGPKLTLVKGSSNLER
jgi:hypothetical protein